MELTSVIMCVAFAGTIPSIAPPISIDLRRARPREVTLNSEVDYSPSTLSFVASSVALGDTQFMPAFSISRATSQTDLVFKQSTPERVERSVINDVFVELRAYEGLTDGWDGPGSVAPQSRDVRRAIAFIGALPTYVPYPTPMVSPRGEVGLYWDADAAFVDISFDEEDQISLYSRRRDVTPQKEKFVDGIEVSSIDDAWFLSELTGVVSHHKLAA